ncbi:YqgE/AlgH family protein [Nakamurella flava]|uniref:UPF0301 protein FDO65_19445 n=1 Tax=Nakamurella flava TaxID=2576308 RepID=A0A4V6CRC7_9ACTN|nr:YqgE/AlgH family protein [Nakamurella flava]TKV56995.1 YqgE/AlgH family protein [Nakamurella flava]
MTAHEGFEPGGAGNSALRPGALLVATPELGDPNFRRTVVYLVAHGEDGTVGLVLNRPSETAVHNVLPEWAPHVIKPQALYVGGPVQTNAAMCVGVCRTGVDPRRLDGVIGVTGPVVLVNLDADPAELSPSLRGARVYAGRAGWSPDQLAGEVAEGAWVVLPGLPDDVLAGPRVDLWFRVLKRQGFPLAWLAYHPQDVTRN